MVGEAAQDRQSLPSAATRCDLCTICLTGGFYSEFTGMFSANRCVTDTITKNASTLQVWSMCNLYSITNESGCDPQSDRVYDTTGAVAVRRAKVA